MLLCIVNESLGGGWSFSKIVHPFLPFYREFCVINKSQEMGRGRGLLVFLVNSGLHLGLVVCEGDSCTQEALSRQVESVPSLIISKQCLVGENGRKV